MSARVPLLLACLVGLVLARPPVSRAQIAPLTYELRAGGAVPLGAMDTPASSWAGDLDAGPSFGMSFAYAVRWYMAPYAGFSQHRWGCGATGCGKETDLVGTGFDAGIRWILGSGRIIPLLRTGLLTYRLEGSAPADGGGVRSVTSHRNIGLEAGGAISVRLSRRLVVAPGLRYVWMDSRFPGQGVLPGRSLVADVGLLLGF